VTLVVKVGGAPGNGLDGLLDEIAQRPDRDLVLVHGGSDEVDRLGAALGRPSEYYTTPTGVVSRRSDPAHLEVLVLALAGAVQTRLVAALAGRGVGAVGLSGVDGGLLRARRKDGARAVVDGRVVVVKDDRSGTIESVNADLLRVLLARGLLPVVGPPAITATGEVVNVDADRVAAAVAVALGAEALLLLTNVPGLLRDPKDSATLLPTVSGSEIDSVLPLAAGRMRKKVLAARTALEGKVRRVVVAPSHGPTPIAHALAGSGTVFS
jgi:[amino group carrier protein]-L-2-aminoadipate 6-kinase